MRTVPGMKELLREYLLSACLVPVALSTEPKYIDVISGSRTHSELRQDTGQIAD
jgi:hypothetical protein